MTVAIISQFWTRPANRLTNRPLDSWKALAPALTPPARRLEHQRQNNETRAARWLIHLKPRIGVILRRSNRCTPKKIRRCLNKLGERIKPNQFRKKQWYEPRLVCRYAHGTFYSTRDTVISVDITAVRTLQRWRKELTSQ